MIGDPQRPSGTLDLHADANLILDVLFELRDRTRMEQALEPLWELLAQTLERLQRRKRRYAWERLQDPGLATRILNEAAAREGGPAAALLHALQPANVNGMVRKGIPWNVLVAARNSRNPAVRWIAVWASAVLRSPQEITVQRLLDDDPSPAIRSLSCRILVKATPGTAAPALLARVDGPCQVTAAGAIIALGSLGTTAAVEALVARATAVFDAGADIADPLAATVVGALENHVARTRPEPCPRELLAVFERGLASTNPGEAASAASALGKIGYLAAWDRLAALVSTSRAPLADPQLRASAMFALDQLADRGAPAVALGAIALYRGRLEDPAEIAAVRQPASSGLARLAKAGLLDDSALTALLAHLGDSSRSVILNCVRALSQNQQRLDPRAVARCVSALDATQRVRLCTVLARQPSPFGAVLLGEMRRDDRADVISALGFAARQLLFFEAAPGELRGELAEESLDGLIEFALISSTRTEPVLRSSGIALIGALLKMPGQQEHARLLEALQRGLDDADERVRSQAQHAADYLRAAHPPLTVS